MTEKEKMLKQMMYDANYDKELLEERNKAIFNVEIFVVMKISKLSPLYAANETNPSTYHCTPSGKGLRPSFRPFCTIFLQSQEAVTKLFEFCNSPDKNLIFKLHCKFLRCFSDKLFKCSEKV